MYYACEGIPILEDTIGNGYVSSSKFSIWHAIYFFAYRLLEITDTTKVKNMRRPLEKGEEKRKSERLDEVVDHEDPSESEYLPLDTTHSQALEPSPPPTNTEELEPKTPKRPKMIHKKIHVSDSTAQNEMEALEAEQQKENPNKKFVK